MGKVFSKRMLAHAAFAAGLTILAIMAGAARSQTPTVIDGLDASVAKSQRIASDTRMLFPHH